MSIALLAILILVSKRFNLGGVILRSLSLPSVSALLLFINKLIFVYLTVLLGFIIQLFVIFPVLMDRGTMNAQFVTNYALGLVAISALCFTFVPAIKGFTIASKFDVEVDIERLRITALQSGIDMLMATVYVIMATLLKYGAVNPPLMLGKDTIAAQIFNQLTYNISGLLYLTTIAMTNLSLYRFLNVFEEELRFVWGSDVEKRRVLKRKQPPSE